MNSNYYIQTRKFAEGMMDRLEANEDKGDFTKWDIDKWGLEEQAQKNLENLRHALARGDQDSVSQYCFDAANYLMLLRIRYGKV